MTNTQKQIAWGLVVAALAAVLSALAYCGGVLG